MFFCLLLRLCFILANQARVWIHEIKIMFRNYLLSSEYEIMFTYYLLSYGLGWQWWEG